MSGGSAAGAALLALALAAAGEAAAVLRDGGYEGLLAAVHPRVPEDGRLVARLQEMITEASSYLFNATKGRVYFRSVKILIPPTWREKSYEKPKHETYEKADVIVAAPYWKHGDDPYTLQHDACGKMGKYIHFTPNFLVNDYVTDIYGSRGRTFVHEWAHLRWGVFDEYDDDRPFYVTGQNQVKVTRWVVERTASSINVSTIFRNFIHLETVSMQRQRNLIRDGNWISRLHQAAELYLLQIVEENSYVGIVTFGDKAEIKTHMHQVVSDDARKQLASYLPTAPRGKRANVCAGLRLACEIESAGESIAGHQQLRRTVTIDSTVGRETFFVATWQAAEPPEIILVDPIGRSYTNKDFDFDSVFHVARLQIPGAAETGDWTYTLINVHLAPQVLALSVTSRAANSTIPAVAVKTYMSKDTTFYPSAVVAYVQISQGFSPILGASVTAIISSENGDPVAFELLDNGAGSDIVKNDGIYSKYLFSFSGNGRYSLKVHVQANRTTVPQTPMPWSHAMYIPGYVENGKLKMNPSRPLAIKNNFQVRRGGFSRTAVGDSFTVSAVPIGPYIDVFPPCKIIDLDARIEDDKVILTWTAPGGDFDKGQAASYEIRTSKTPLELRDSFYNTTFVNTSTLSPQCAGRTEVFVFKPEAFTTGNITVVYVAIRAVDEGFLRSELSNIAQAVMFIPPMAYPTSNTKFGVSTVLLLFFGLLMVVCLTLLHVAKGSMVWLNESGYEDLVVAINPKVPEDANIISNTMEQEEKMLDLVAFLSIAIHADTSMDQFPDDQMLARFLSRVFVHEWAHLRWGVFDEYNDNAPFYVSEKAGVQATRCSAGVIGKPVFQNCIGNKCETRECKYDGQLYEAGCVFIPELNQNSKNSIMYMQYLPSVVEFCDKDTHNYEAPNMQNKICNYKSTWETIMESDDFRNSSIVNSLKPPFETTFQILQTQDRAVSLVLDVSGSMLAIITERINTTYGSEIVLLTDGEDSGMSVCREQVRESGAIIHTIALGPSAASELEEFSNMTGGLKLYAVDVDVPSKLIEAFSEITAGSGDISEQSIQLESKEQTVPSSGWINDTVTIDNTVGNDTFFVFSWSINQPFFFLRDPKGKEYRSSDFTIDTSNLKTARLGINGTAEVGDWHYYIQNVYTTAQVISVTVTSRAASSDIPPVTVHAYMEVANISPNPIVVYAEVSQGFLPVLGATVIATIEDGSTAKSIPLIDNGTGKIQMNAPRPEVADEEIQANLGSFSRISTSSIKLNNLPNSGYPPCKITDLDAYIENETVVLTWTAPGGDLDNGKAEYYIIKSSANLLDLRDEFDNATSVDSSHLIPQEAGSSETLIFKPENLVIENGTIIYIAIRAVDDANLTSVTSNIAKATWFTPPKASVPSDEGNASGGVNITAIVAVVAGAVLASRIPYAVFLQV
ncbi:hypothetical protein ASZ78_013734 [Callipepla squamata]|uniref:Calcium-activated chloride channel N-terminal domain-containing protein n=1 Tax=Callipepla squamata TaxID=9009 RepID=A0A226N6U0_CALSU|nr:hypothetical protein ASZ78_013734 [Callipepla squamata]